MSDGKSDEGKRRWHLLPMEQVESLIDVLEYGARKYSEDSWRQVPDGKRRYYNAAMRHLVAWSKGERLDPESGLHHLAHAAVNCLFIMGHE